MYIRIWFFFFFPFFLSCSDISRNLENALEQAGKNKAELEKVLKKYAEDPNDSLKYMAAVFLIENMPGYYYYEGEPIIKYKDFFVSLRNNDNESINVLDSIAKVNGKFDITKATRRYDIEIIDSSYLVDNIELAFKVWRGFPWSKNYSFEDFCEFILPYRTENEELSQWRKTIYNDYSSFLKDVHTKDPIEVASLLRDSVLNRVGLPRFTMVRPGGYPSLDAITSCSLAGTCDDLAQFTIALYRTFGIVCTKDYVPVRGSDNYGHSWVSLKDHKQHYYVTDFFDEISYISDTTDSRTMMKTKVYRRTYSKDWSGLMTLRNELGLIPKELEAITSRSVDVTPLYSNNLTDINMLVSDLYNDNSSSKIFFLCAPSWMSWKPIAWAKADKSGNVSFKNVDAGSIIRIAIYEDDVLKLNSDPFYVDKQNRSKIFFTGEGGKDDITLLSKYSLNRDLWLRKRVIGAVIEASDNSAFLAADTLGVVRELPIRLFTEIYCQQSEKKYKYVRYRGKEGSHCNIAEIAFFSDDDDQLEGEIIGEPGAWRNNQLYEYTSAMDGLTETSYDHQTRGKGWVGLRLNRSSPVKKIRFTPRNYGNYIKPDDVYELFIDTKDGWKSYGGRKKASTDSLLFKDIPVKALLYLKNHSGGNDERLFSVEDGVQKFK